jgi:hypothetical protein
MEVTQEYGIDLLAIQEAGGEEGASADRIMYDNLHRTIYRIMYHQIRY